jgi:hypothetical protein
MFESQLLAKHRVLAAVVQTLPTPSNTQKNALRVWV